MGSPTSSYALIAFLLTRSAALDFGLPRFAEGIPFGVLRGFAFALLNERVPRGEDFSESQSVPPDILSENVSQLDAPIYSRYLSTGAGET
jgi:hypothetical protein